MVVDALQLLLLVGDGAGVACICRAALSRKIDVLAPRSLFCRVMAWVSRIELDEWASSWIVVTFIVVECLWVPAV